MTVSNSTDFTETAQELIHDALSELGVNQDEEPLGEVDFARGMRAMNRMLKAWQADGIQVWTMTDASITLVQGVAGYLLGPGGAFETRPFDIMTCDIVRDGNEIPMTRLSREQYQDMPNKITQGYPTQFYYDRQRDNGTLYVWPTPDAALGTLTFNYRRVIMDMDVASNNIDLPQEWHSAIVFNLAEMLIGPYAKQGSPEARHVMTQASKSYLVVKGWDIGEGLASVNITPDYDGSGYGYGRGRGWR